MIGLVNSWFRSCMYICILLYQLEGVRSLKNVHLKSKMAVRRGESLHLKCDYDLENAQLYSIKWYFADNEFYRYVPKESPPAIVFVVAGISVDVSQSDNKTVTLSNVQRNLTGFYKCEVSADAPLFHTDIKSTIIFVTDPPERPLIIFSQKSKQKEHEVISTTCTSGRAYPASNLTWYINGQILNSHAVKLVSSVSSDADGLETASSKLEISTSANSAIFVDNRVKLKCEAWQFDVYRESVETEIVDDTPQLAHVLSPTPSNSHAASYLKVTTASVILISIKVITIVNFSLFNGKNS